MRQSQGKNNFWETLSEVLYYTALFVGYQVLAVLKHLCSLERQFSVWAAEKLTPPLNWVYSGITRVLCGIGAALSRPFRTAARGVRLIKRNVSDAAKIGPKYAIAAFFHTLWRGLRRNGFLFKTMLNYIAPVVGVIILVHTVNTVASVKIMLEVRYEGQLLGYIEEENVYSHAMTMFQQRIIYEEGDTPFQAKPEFRLSAVAGNTPVGEEALVDRMVALSTKDIVESNGIYIDDVFHGAVKDVTEINETVEALLEKYRTDAKNETVELVRPFRVVTGLYPTASVVEEQKILDLLNSEVAGEVIYTIQEGDTPSGVASAHDIAYEDFKALNPDCEERFLIGDTVYLAKSEPYMAVKVIRRETRTEEKKYKTETTEDSTKSVTYSKVTQKGANGITEITEDIEYVNGIEIARTEVSTKVLQKLKNEKIVIGTKITGSSSLANGGISLNGLNFIWPLNGGRLEDPYGWRDYRMHYGQDIIAPVNTEIYAAEDGTVELSRWYSSFGRCVIIDHGGGVKTLYAHANRLLVSAGQKVKKGDVIALVGSTGWSEGYHLHFELRVNGSRIDPKPYITH